MHKALADMLVYFLVGKQTVQLVNISGIQNYCWFLLLHRRPLQLWRMWEPVYLWQEPVERLSTPTLCPKKASTFSEVCTNNAVEVDFLGFPKVKWRPMTGEVDKSVRFSCQIFSGFNMPKVTKID